jgi:hypothetical protein
MMRLRPQYDPLGAVLQLLSWLTPVALFCACWAAVWACWTLAYGPAEPNAELRRALLSGLAVALGGLAVALVWYVRGGERR